jgi:hypothetical protein
VAAPSGRQREVPADKRRHDSLPPRQHGGLVTQSEDPGALHCAFSAEQRGVSGAPNHDPLEDAREDEGRACTRQKPGKGSAPDLVG